MPDAAFESAFSELAHASLREKAPGLMEYLVGFQILDKNDEETHAVAVFGFKIGNQWFYAPVFFMNGALKGSDLLYVKGQDLFVPLQDNWVNYLLSKRPALLGDAEPKDEAELDIDVPNFRVFAQPPSTGSASKWASLQPGRLQQWARNFLPAYADAVLDRKAQQQKAAAARADLKNLFAECPALAAPFAQTCATNMKFAEAVLGFYPDLGAILPDPGTVKQALQSLHQPHAALNPGNTPVTSPMRPMDATSSIGPKQIQSGGTAPRDVSGLPSPVSPVPEKSTGLATTGEPVGSEKVGAEEIEDEQRIVDDELGDVRVYTAEAPADMVAGDLGSQVLTDEEKQQLMEGEIVVHDSRSDSQKSKIYNARTEQRLQNPHESGVYDVLGKGGEFRRCFVCTTPQPIGRGRVVGVSVVVDLDNQAAQSFYTGNLFVSRAQPGADTFGAPTEELWDKTVEPGSMKPGYLYVLLKEDGACTIPFKFLEAVSNSDGTTQMRVSPRTGVDGRPQDVKGSPYSPHHGNYEGQGPGIHLEDGGCGGNVLASGTWEYDAHPFSLWEYEEGRNILLSDRENLSEFKISGATLVAPANVRALQVGDARNNAKHTPEYLKKMKFLLDPGTLVDVEMLLMKTAQLIDVHTDGPELVVRYEQGQQRLRKSAALEHLILQWGLGEDDARQLLKEAGRKPQRYYIKQAAIGPGPSAPPFPDYASGFNTATGVPVVEDQRDFERVPGMGEPGSARDEYKLMDDPEVAHALEAAESGKKDVFDTAVMTGLVKTVDVDAVVDSFLPDIIRGMDRVGRVLFMFYWHNESFRERYGRQELMELEDALRNVFKSQGDLVIFLKQKTIEADPVDDALSIDIGALA